MNEQAHVLFKWSAVAACALASALALAQPGSGDPSMAARQCSANSSCGLTNINCSSLQDACCCKFGAGAWTCGCWDPTSCTSPPSGWQCETTP